jgi:FkbH-like protein
MKLIEALGLLRRVDPGWPLMKVGLICGFTAQPLDTFFAAHLQSRTPNRRVEVQTGRFGDLLGNFTRYLQEPLGAAALVMEWSDLDSRLGWREHGGWGRAKTADICATVSSQLSVLEQAITRAADAGALAVALPSVPLPPVEPVPASLYGALQCRLDAQVLNFAGKLSSLQHVRLVNPARLAATSPQEQRLDVKATCQGGFPYQLQHADAVAQLLAEVLAPAPPLKGIITDLDNTLWNGIVGEVGGDGVHWDLEHHSAQHGAYQQMLQSLAESGVMVAIASKNDPQVVKSALERADILLRADSVFPIEVHWNPKSESVGRILRGWNIAADSVVFIDDSKLELAEVRNAHPSIQCRLFDPDPDRVAALTHELASLFGKPFDSAEDSLRLKSLRAEAELQTEIDGAKSLEEVLSGANGVLTIRAVSNPPDPRARELINKTNQFNLNGRRLSDADWLEFLQTPDHVAWIVSYEDRFGSLGKISVLVGRKTGSVLEVETWVLSCRAFARRIEYAMLKELFEREGLSRINFHFLPTERNGPIQELLQQLSGEAPAGTCGLSSGDFAGRKLPWYMRVEFAS